MLQKELADSGIIHVQPVCLHQSYHIIGVFYNASLMAVFDRMALERDQVPRGLPLRETAKLFLPRERR
ncbi:MAG TPA: hypothetical protein VKA81_02765 [Verrucomicrobiae bacterium]|nr:hypothetical protein [Verrucomicrobiae bacterium]